LDAEDRVWGQINHERVALRLKQLWKQRQKEIRKGLESVWYRAATPPSSQTRDDIVDLAVKQYRLWLDDNYAAYQYVWELQKKKRTPEFVRAVFRNAIAPAIKDLRTFINELIVRASEQLRGFQGLRPLSLGEWWGLDYEENLSDDWREKTEDEAMELEPKRPEKRARRTSGKESGNIRLGNGAICSTVIGQLKRIRSMHPSQSVDQIRERNPNWFLWKMMERSPFTDKDRENLQHPDQWPGTTEHGISLLMRNFSKSERSIKRWIAIHKAYKLRRPGRDGAKNS
jgi:hypothetical protein